MLALPLLLVIGSKGALIVRVLVTPDVPCSASCLRMFRTPLWYFVVALAIYACAGIAVGIRAGDYHVIGFLGGLNGFLANPLGRGIGAGGNLSLDGGDLRLEPLAAARPYRCGGGKRGRRAALPDGSRGASSCSACCSGSS